MTNLIPPEARTRIVAEYWLRVATILLFLVAVAALAVIAFLLPSYVLVTAQVQSFAAEVEIAKASVAHSDGTARMLVIAGDQARLLVQAEQTKRFSDIISAVSSKTVEGIEVTEYGFSRAGDALAPVRIGGTAATRQALAAFRDALLDHAEVTEVNLPISNFAKDRGIQFSLTITIASTVPTTPTP